MNKNIIAKLLFTWSAILLINFNLITDAFFISQHEGEFNPNNLFSLSLSENDVYNLISSQPVSQRQRLSIKRIQNLSIPQVINDHVVCVNDFITDRNEISKSLQILTIKKSFSITQFSTAT
ncbi:MAG: hypothetical protein K9J16_04930 [Melioribacteraceae bacterium]|nr:hypothetical protein [Melioribacteraceae bacterium]MCF8355776.1 hypothetical protein [Melioribacteraceae bacterium]MCF8392834.1 hypothetical protein [Melioribacteraceae bacterium]MCF8418680.1 hypothetical protein [Melioribacteraceae bacterium]